MTMQEQRQRSADLFARCSAIMARADTEQRDLNEEEAREFDVSEREYQTVIADIGRRERLENAGAYQAAPAAASGNGHTAAPAAANGNGNAANGGPPARRALPQSVPAGHAAPNAPQRSGYRIQVEDRAAGTFGFRDFGEFAQAVHEASIPGNRRTDPRLTNSAGPPDSVMTEGVPADGGYAVPPDFRPDIQSLIEAENSLLSMTDQITTSSNAVTLPIDAAAPWATAGIQAYWEAEAALKLNSKMNLDQLTVRLFKLYALVPVSDELLEDAPALGVLLRKKAPEVMDYRINQAILYGSGTGMPLGIHKSPGALTVPRATPGKITTADIIAMWGACYAASRSRAVWVTNQAVETLMMTMFTPITDGTGNIVNGFPTYMPPGGLSAAPYGTLLGRPVISSAAAPALGQKGDISLLDLQSYLTVQKVSGIRQDISIHLWFDYDITCFRFVLRLGGGPFWKTPLADPSGTVSYSPFVLLDGTANTMPMLGTPGERRQRELEAENPNAPAVTRQAAVYSEHEATKRSNEAVAAAEKDRETKRRSGD